MSFIENYFRLKNSMDLVPDEIAIPSSDMVIRNFEFKSEMPDEISFSLEDKRIKENFYFRYPVILKKNAVKSDKAIIYLHGLNERTWDKHLTGAKLLAEKSKKPVLLFPLSFHINRGLSDWTDARKMIDPLGQRKQKFSGIRESSVINLALSKRLTESPERFFLSGYQSTLDLISLIKSIKAGGHPVYEKNASTDLFAYSISCMLLQSLMISNTKGILNNSRIVLFAGGSIFSKINGVSKFIMDNVAFDTLMKYYLNITSTRNNIAGELRSVIMESEFGRAFRSLILPEKFRNKRERGISKFHKDLMVVALRDDKVMPVKGIKEALGRRFALTDRFNILHFPYPYTHENPFPVLYNKIEKQVEEAFYSVFNPALQFFTGN